jgi:hypothetical protein
MYNVLGGGGLGSGSCNLSARSLSLDSRRSAEAVMPINARIGFS